MKRVYRIDDNGSVFYPHISKDGDFILSIDPKGSDVRLEENYIREPDPARFLELVTTGRYHIRMKTKGSSPSMIRPAAIIINDDPDYLDPSQLKNEWIRRHRKRRGTRST